MDVIIICSLIALSLYLVIGVLICFSRIVFSQKPLSGKEFLESIFLWFRWYFRKIDS